MQESVAGVEFDPRGPVVTLDMLSVCVTFLVLSFRHHHRKKKKEKDTGAGMTMHATLVQRADKAGLSAFI
jgi:hypothetical protein